jgi:hypothetical protein
MKYYVHSSGLAQGYVCESKQPWMSTQWVEISAEEANGFGWRKDLAVPLEPMKPIFVSAPARKNPFFEMMKPDDSHALWLADCKRRAMGEMPPLQRAQVDAMMARRAAVELREKDAKDLADVERVICQTGLFECIDERYFRCTGRPPKRHHPRIQDGLAGGGPHIVDTAPPPPTPLEYHSSFVDKMREAMEKIVMRPPIEHPQTATQDALLREMARERLEFGLGLRQPAITITSF